MSSETGRPRRRRFRDIRISGGQAADKRKAIEESLHWEWYTVAQAAAYLDEHPKTIYGRVSRGELQASRPSPRKIRVHRSDLVTYLMKGTS